MPGQYKRAAAGFTLLEILAVMGILAAVLALGSTQLFNQKERYRSYVTKVAVATRELRNSSRLKNQTTRMAVQFSGKDIPGKIATQSAPGNVPTLTPDQMVEVDRMRDDEREAFLAKFKFSEDKSLKELEPPRGLYIISVEYASRRDPVAEGVAYIHFYPNGLAEESLITFSDGKTLFWTVGVSALTNRAQIFEKKVTMEEWRDQ